jgi:hypothetical protein
MSPSSSAPASASMKLKGFSLSSKPFSKSTSTVKPTAPTKLGKRPRTALHPDSSDSEQEPEHVAVTAFGASGAEHEDDERRREQREREQTRVIEKLPNKDWRAEARKRQGRNLLPAEVQAARAAAARSNTDAEGERERMDGKGVEGEGEGIKWGLTLRKKENVEGTMQDSHEMAAAQISTDRKEEHALEGKEKPKTVEEEAIEALMGKKSKPTGPALVIPSSSTADRNLREPAVESETDAYHRAIAAAPDVSTLDDYEAMPVEDFGAALLRGMGWKGETVARPKEGKRRLNLLGLGATELKGAEELGAWVQRSDVKRLKPSTSGGGRPERREKPSEYREREDKKRRERDERYGNGYRDDRRDSGKDSGRDSGRERERYRDRERERDRDRKR